MQAFLVRVRAGVHDKESVRVSATCSESYSKHDSVL